MRLLIVGLALVALAGQERAELAKPIQTDRTVRSYQITGFNVTIPPTIYKLSTAPSAGAPPVGMFLTNLTIRYVDNLGTEAVDVHTDTDAAQLIRDLVLTSSSSGSVYARLLEHLIKEGKIPAARITK
jgi:hypothetical protein